MAEASIPVDLLNPGQVFACLGFLEAADTLLGNAQGGFDWSDEADVRFRMVADGSQHPVSAVIEFIRFSEAVAVSPCENILERDRGDTVFKLGEFPSKLNDRAGKIRNALLPIELRGHGKSVRFEYWIDLDGGRPILRLWTATNGNSAWVRFRKLRDSVEAAQASDHQMIEDPFGIFSVVAANFRLELRRNWIALDLGFSPDKIKKASGCIPIEIVTYPIVELLASLGLNNARPVELSRDGMRWQYYAWSHLMPVELARVAISQPVFGTSDRRFCMYLEQPNDGGDLSISYANEE